MTAHTPTPWQLHDPDYCDEEVWGDIDGPTDGQVRGKLVAVVDQDNPNWHHNAAFIVRAANCFDDLVAALRSFVEPWNRGGRDWQAQFTYDTFSKARDALAKAGR